MLLGLQTFANDRSISPSAFAVCAEESGFESVFFPEESHIPVRYDDGSPTGGTLPDEYYRVYDPIVSMTYAASATTTVRIGSAVCTVAQRDALQLAKEIASLDHLSGGRVLLGVGAGWNETILRNHRVDPTTRWRAVRSKILAMSTVWDRDEASYRDDVVQFDDVYQWPKPVQRPRPPILLGSAGPKALDRVLEYADGWMPFRPVPEASIAPDQPEPFEAEFAARVDELHRRGVESGRGKLPVTLFNALPIADALHRYRKAGVARCIFHIPSAEPHAVADRIGELADIVADWRRQEGSA